MKEVLKIKSFHQGGNIYIRHLYCILKPRGDGCMDVKSIEIKVTRKFED